MRMIVRHESGMRTNHHMPHCLIYYAPTYKKLPIKMSTKIKKKLIVQFLMFFSIFDISHCYAVAVGDSYGGGTVFCVSQTPDTTKCITEGSGDYGLIMANEDQANYDSNPKHGVSWSSKYYKTGALSNDDGAANTATIIATLPEDNPSNNAAWLCHNYRDQERHTDWYLPSENELNKMYIYASAHNLIGKDCSGSNHGGVQCLVSGSFNTKDYDAYWSSTEYSGFYTNAWLQNFSNGFQLHYGKISYYLGARAIRAFNNSPIQPINNIDEPKKGLAEVAEKIKEQESTIRTLNDALTGAKQEAVKYKDALATNDKTVKDKVKILEAANKIAEDKVKTLETTLAELKQKSNYEIKALEEEIKTLNTKIHGHKLEI